MRLQIVVKEPQEVETIFVGGGTPTRLDPIQLRRLTDVIGRWFSLTTGGEWTVEANPGTLDEEKVDDPRRRGGEPAQPGSAVLPARPPDGARAKPRPGEVRRAIELVRPRIDRWSLDLIFGIPGSTLADCAADLEAALALGPSHLSCYGLVYEKGTQPLEAVAGRQVRPSTRKWSGPCTRQSSTASNEAGLLMYEISNYARPGHESRHNLVYWANDAYFGFGLGAARYVEGVRIGQHERPGGLSSANRERRAGDRAHGKARTRRGEPARRPC